MRRPRRVRLLWMLVSVAALLALAIASVCIGARDVALDDIVAALQGHDETIARAAVTKRIPRTLLAMLAGGALAVSGAVMQGVTRNPLADPGILGVNTGASLAVVIGIAWIGISSVQSYIWLAIVGAALAAVFVYAIGSLGRGGPTPLKLALAGAATSTALASFVSAVVLPRGDVAGLVRSWEIGGVGGATIATVGTVAPFLGAGLLISVLMARSLNSLALGDELASGLGERVELARAIAALGAVLLCAAVTAVAGPIGFVGLVVAHLCRTLAGPDHRWLIPFSAVAGAALLTGADVLGRLVARPDEIDVGIITAIVGAPFLIWIIRRGKVREL
nr:iron ABC transporter permease [Schumannella luteola]